MGLWPVRPEDILSAEEKLPASQSSSRWPHRLQVYVPFRICVRAEFVAVTDLADSAVVMFYLAISS